MDQETPQRPIPELATSLMSSVLEGTESTLKLYFTVSTGALVLFTNHLAGSSAPKFILMILASSILAFGASALLCLRVLLGVVKLRILLAEAFTTQMPLDSLEKRMKEWSKEGGKVAKRMEWLFYAGVAFAALFVVGIVLVR